MRRLRWCASRSSASIPILPHLSIRAQPRLTPPLAGYKAIVPATLHVMAVLKAARDFGLPPERAAEVALSTGTDPDRLAEGLAQALVEAGAVQLPDAA
jgi:hypothetical protein